MISQARNYEFLISEFSRTFGSHYLRIGGLDVLGRGPASSYSQAAPRGWPISPEPLWISRGCSPPFSTRRSRSACGSQCSVFVYVCAVLVHKYNKYVVYNHTDSILRDI